MKRIVLFIGGILFLALTSCRGAVETQNFASPQQDVSPELLYIDSLMWYHPDSAFWHIGRYFKPNGDNVSTISTRTEYNRRYAYLLLAELLFKNHYPQTCRENLLRSVGYFDSLMMVDTSGADAFNASLRAFLAARAHYMNGVGYYEHDSVIEAYNEYIRALEIVENHFPIVETLRATSLQVNHIPRFMMLVYCRLGGLFSDQYMQEPAIYCFKKALILNKLEPVAPDNYSNLLFHVGFQFDKMQQWDSALYYYDEALQQLPDTNRAMYRTLMSYKANINYRSGEGVEPAVNDLKRIARQGNPQEKPTHFFLIGQIYYAASQNDSALVYLTTAFEQSRDSETKTLAAKYLHDIYHSRGDTLKAAQYAVYHAENTEQERVKMAQVSQLNELFQKRLQQEREACLLRERQKRVKMVLCVGLPLTVLVTAFVIVLAKRRNRKRMAAQEAETQRQLNEAQQRHDEGERELQTKMEQAAQHTREVLQQRAMTIYQSGGENRLKQILAEFEAVYPQAMTELSAAHPELSETEQNIAVLNFLRFRSKEEAELMGFTEYTALKYRSNLKKKAGSNPISALSEAGKI